MSICFCSISIASETIRLTSGEWPPYFSKDLKHYGVGSRIVSEAFALEGIKVEYGFFPWKRSLILAKEGEWDGAVGWEMSSGKEPDFFASNQVWESPWVFFHLKSYPFDWKTFDDLKNVSIGGTLGYMYTPGFLEAEHSGKIKVERTRADTLNFKKLSAGRIDIFPQSIDVGYFQLRSLFDQKTVALFTHHNTPLGKHAEHLLLSRKHDRNKQMIEIFNNGLKKLKESGKYDLYFEESRRGEYGEFPEGQKGP